MVKSKRFYRGDPYWTQERPHVAITEKLILSYYPQAGKLQISQRWDNEHGPQKGKTVTLDSEDLQLAPEALKLLIEALGDWQA